MTSHVESPYKGLAPFAEEDSLYFFGREREQQILATNLRASRLTLLFGDSGAGKSSVLRAGVVPRLRRMAREQLDQTGSPRLVVAVFRDWRADPIEGMKTAAREGLRRAFSGLPVALPEDSLPLAETIRACAAQAGGPILFILDQFDEYFLYRDPARSKQTPDGFDEAFPRLLQDRSLPVNFLLSIRSDAHDRLEHFKDRIPHIFDNAVRIEHLDRAGAREAIEKPIRQYNRLHTAGGRRIDIEADLVEEVLRQLEASRLAFDEAGQGGGARTEGIKTPFLQLVMYRLWEEETRAGSATLRLATLRELGDAGGIVSSHLDSAMASLTESERWLMARVFRYLVTPSGTKIAYAAADLAEYLRKDLGDETGAQVNVDRMTLMLEKLSSSGARLLNPVALPGRGSSAAIGYEISHDVLAPAILRYVRRVEQEEAELRAAQRAAEQAREEARQRRLELAEALAEEQSARAREKTLANRRLKWMLALATLLAVAAGLSAWIAKTQRDNAVQARLALQQSVERERRTNNQILPGFAELLYDTDNFDKTLERFQGALDFARREGNRVREGLTLASIGQLDFRAGKLSEARENYETAVKILETELPDHPFLGATFNGLAAVYAEEGQFQPAEQLYQRARELLQKTVADPSKDIAMSLSGLATVYQKQGKFDRAESLFRQALDIDQRLFGSLHQQVALDQAALGGLFFAQGRYATAEQFYQQSIETLEKTPALGPEDPAVGQLLVNLASLYRAQGKFADARRQLERAIAIQEKHLDLSPLPYLRATNVLGELENDQKRYQEAASIFVQTLPALEKTLGSEHPEIGATLDNLAYAYRGLGQCGKAAPLLQRALRIQQPESLDAAYSMNLQADCAADQKRDAEAEQLYQRVLKIRREKLGEEKEEVAYTLDGLGSLYARQGRNAEAEAAFKQAISIREKVLGPRAPHLADTLERYAALLRAMKRDPEAASIASRAREIRTQHP